MREIRSVVVIFLVVIVVSYLTIWDFGTAPQPINMVYLISTVTTVCYYFISLIIFRDNVWGFGGFWDNKDRKKQGK